MFDGADLPSGCHVNAVGTYTTDARELDESTIVRAKVVVEDREAALAEAGELVIPIEAGVITTEHILAELADVAAGTAVRTSDDDVTVFKSVGVAFEDLVIAAAVAERL